MIQITLKARRLSRWGPVKPGSLYYGRRRLADCLAKAHVSGPAGLFYLISRPVASAFDRVKIRSAEATRSVSVQTGLAEMKSGEGTLIAFAT